jgi:hypothetical protein
MVVMPGIVNQHHPCGRPLLSDHHVYGACPAVVAHAVRDKRVALRLGHLAQFTADLAAEGGEFGLKLLGLFLLVFGESLGENTPGDIAGVFDALAAENLLDTLNEKVLGHKCVQSGEEKYGREIIARGLFSWNLKYPLTAPSPKFGN